VKPRAKTSIKYRTLNPLWNEEFTIAGLLINQTLTISVMDHDVIGADDLLGRASVSLSSLPVNTKVSLMLSDTFSCIEREQLKSIC
jgi:Ca2+-dependent lipid-binding protein